MISQLTIWRNVVADNSVMLKALKSNIANYASMRPMELAAELRNPALVAKMKKMGVDDRQIARVILILQQQKPSAKELAAYLNSSLV